jgi:hypothetical protein
VHCKKPALELLRFNKPMKAITPLQPFVEVRPTEALSWSQASACANIWRAQAMQAFAQAEAAVSEALIAIHQVPKRGAAVALRHLIGQCFEDLAKATGEGGAFEVEGRGSVKALANFMKHIEFRNVLCHGVMKLTKDRSDNWIIIMRVSTFKGGKTEHTTHACEENNAMILLGEVQAASQRLCATLGSLRKNCASA